MKSPNQYLVALGVFSFAMTVNFAGAQDKPSEIPLDLKVTPLEEPTEKKTQCGFVITFHNKGDLDLLLNVGNLLGNGSQIWSSLVPTLKDDAGKIIPFFFRQGDGAVAGRLYFLGLPLPASSSFSLTIAPKDYQKLEPGKYQLTFRYEGRQSENRDGTELPPCWTGEIESNTARFTLPPAP